ncbi:serine hydrolase [Anaeroselena agilis]|uniref:Serine hydrolase n=1 Tax=Anaeroselena agilis TaxID=3063788 RepID=A0ABU3NUV6_9FIRM|nr:serine hydrolase [Selenomonadales bacterium 4137-cl]
MNKRLCLALLLTVFLSACAQAPPAPKPAPEPQAGGAPTDPARSIHLAVERFDGQAGVFVKNLGDGRTVGVNADKIFPTASTNKLVVALAVYRYLYSEAAPVQRREYDRAIKAMMVTSDNPSFYRLLDEIAARKPDALTRVLADLRLTHTRVNSGEAFNRYGYHSVTTPREMATVFETIYNEAYLGKEMSAILKEELANTVFREEIPRFMQRSRVMHKVGSLPGLLCDVGIVDDGRDKILISVFATTLRPEAYASSFIAHTSAASYNALRTK